VFKVNEFQKKNLYVENSRESRKKKKEKEIKKDDINSHLFPFLLHELVLCVCGSFIWIREDGNALTRRPTIRNLLPPPRNKMESNLEDGGPRELRHTAHRKKGEEEEKKSATCGKCETSWGLDGKQKSCAKIKYLPSPPKINEIKAI